MNKHSDLEPAEVVEQLENELIDLAVVKWIAGDLNPSDDQERAWVKQVQNSQSEEFYSNLLFTLTGRRYSHQGATRLWDSIIAHRDSLSEKLGRNPGIVVACLDYLTNCLNSKIDFRLIENQRLENMLERAVADSLTGLYDHDTLLSLLNNEVERSIRHNHTVSFILMDLDDFKMINDTHGHQKGDEALVRLAQTVDKTIRIIDTAGRYGGEEFAIILPETNKSAATRTAERLRKAVRSEFKKDLNLTVSIGVAACMEDGTSTESIVKVADERLYKAKEKGKNCVVS